mmetsp:Transcript_68198/g.190358  ORF Transcript_68198/g.190358 Transcript_68198/m.190358 type:complete len:304 (+) Transcript_68198:763-1674(+)
MPFSPQEPSRSLSTTSTRRRRSSAEPSLASTLQTAVPNCPRGAPNAPAPRNSPYGSALLGTCRSCRAASARPRASRYASACALAHASWPSQLPSMPDTPGHILRLTTTAAGPAARRARRIAAYSASRSSPSTSSLGTPCPESVWRRSKPRRYCDGCPEIVTSLSSMNSLTGRPLATAKRAASALLPSICEPSEPRQQTILSGCARLTPLRCPHKCPRRPELNSMPGVRPSSGWPGRSLCPCRYFSSFSAGMWPRSTESMYCVATRCPASSNIVGTNMSGLARKNASSKQTSGAVSKAPPVWPP